MSRLATLFAIMVLPFLLASAAECKDGDSCEKKEVADETSLVQLTNVLKKLVSRSSPQEDEDFKPLPQNHTKIDEALKRKAAGNGLPMTKHRIVDNKTDHKDKDHPDGQHPAAPTSPGAPGSPAEKKEVEKSKAKEEDEKKKLRKEIEVGGGSAGSSGTGSGGANHESGNPEKHKERLRDDALRAAIAEVDLQDLEVAEAQKNEAMARAANAAAAEDRVALQLAAQAQKLAEANKAMQGAGPADANDKKLAEAIVAEVSAEMDELKARSKIEKQALQDALEKVEAAEYAASKIAKDAQKEAQSRAA